jgi:predicted alpha/beta superfamily hydrolase
MSALTIGSLARTNAEIRIYLEAAERRRQQRLRETEPRRTLDRLIAEMEACHERGLVFLPGSLLRRLTTLEETLPSHVRFPRRWRRKISAAIEQCFQLQAQLQARN